MKKLVLCVAAHPDDEVLGAGGALSRLTREGWDAMTVIMATGAASRASASEDAHNEILKLRDSASRAAHALGTMEPKFLAFPDNAMDSVPLLDICKALEEVTRDTKPQLVLTHFGGDLNVDHRLTFEAVMTCFRPQSLEAPNILCFEVPSSTGWAGPSSERQFSPTVWMVLDQLDSIAKKRALEAYQSEMREYPHARSLTACMNLLKYRGSQIGAKEAEAFVPARMVLGVQK